MKSIRQSTAKFLSKSDAVHEKQALAILSAIGEPDLIKHWNSLNKEQKQHLFLQLQRIDIPTLRLQQDLIHKLQNKKSPISPTTDYSEAGNACDKELGQAMISQGLVGCLVVAGGQGTRLRIEGPKGICEVTKIKKKSLFQLLAEKTVAASKLAKRPLLLAIMTSPLNHEETLRFFKKNHFFGLNEQQLHFFQQATLPLLNQQGQLFLETQDSLSEGPNGNGDALCQFFKSGIWENWHEKGVRYVNFILIDNALANPFDGELVGYQKRKNSDLVIKCVERKNSEENVGLLVLKNGKTTVIEYSELSEEDRYARHPDGSLRYRLANLSLFSFHMEFIKLAATKGKLSLHKSLKAVKFLNEKGLTIQSEHPMAWKFEKFIFDALASASKVDILVYPRETSFAPLKNFTGQDSFETVNQALEYSDQQTMSTITGNLCKVTPLEISADFYYPTFELLRKWKGRLLTHSGYIES